MKLKFLAISDTHLGEETSLLCFPHGRRRFWSALRDLFGSGSRVSVDEVILVGDIPDRTLSSTSQIITQTSAFMATLGSAVDAGRMIYVPGNHDHTLWSDYDRARHDPPAEATSVAGESIFEGGAIAEGALPAADPLLSLFFGFPDGSQWRAVQEAKGLGFSIANPIYAREHAGRTYVFAHGTHFRPDVTSPVWMQKIADATNLDELFGGIEIKAVGDLEHAKDIVDLERLVTPFVDSLWPSSGSNPTSRSDQAWYLLSYLSGKFSHGRVPPAADALFGIDALARITDDDRIVRLTPEHDFLAAGLGHVERYGNRSIELCRKYFLKHAIARTRAAGLSTDRVTFVFGDTHEGGFGRLPGPTGGEVRVYNTGSWVVHNAAHHPPCHVFAVDEAGNEYLADISFAGIPLDGKTLLDVAAEDAENKKRATSRALRALLAILPVPR